MSSSLYTPTASFASPPGSSQEPRLLDQIRERVRRLNYSIRTEHAYAHWAKRFVLFHGKRHPREMGAPEMEAFFTHLASDRNVAASTQNQALSALLFLYKEVLGIELPWLDNIQRAKKPSRLPTVLTPAEVKAVLSEMSGTPALVAKLLYGTGMRLMEAIRLRVKDVEFERHEIVVRDGKGNKDRVTMLPESLAAGLTTHMVRMKMMHTADLADGMGGVWLPTALAT